MLDDRDAAVLDGAADQAFTATWDDAVDRVVLLEQDVECPTICGWNELHGVLMNAGLTQRALDGLGELDGSDCLLCLRSLL